MITCTDLVFVVIFLAIGIINMGAREPMAKFLTYGIGGIVLGIMSYTMFCL